MVKVSLSGNTFFLRLLSFKLCDAIRPRLNWLVSRILGGPRDIARRDEEREDKMALAGQCFVFI